MTERMVQTTKGLLPESSLTVKEVRDDGDNHTSIAREWYLGDELVRRDAWVTLLRSAAINAQSGQIG